MQVPTKQNFLILLSSCFNEAVLEIVYVVCVISEQI